MLARHRSTPTSRTLRHRDTPRLPAQRLALIDRTRKFRSANSSAADSPATPPPSTATREPDGAASADADTPTNPDMVATPANAVSRRNCLRDRPVCSGSWRMPAAHPARQFDTPFWAARLTALGVADTPIPLRELSAGHLAAALRHAVNEPALHHRAPTLATQLATEDGAAQVLHTVQRFAVPT
jgi:hypothetical protein